MIIVKLTVLAILIFATHMLAMWFYVNGDTKCYLRARMTSKYPKWCYSMVLFLFLSIIGIFASAIYLLFFR